jgi:hypothetical protein
VLLYNGTVTFGIVIWVHIWESFPEGSYSRKTKMQKLYALLLVMSKPPFASLAVAFLLACSLSDFPLCVPIRI